MQSNDTSAAAEAESSCLPPLSSQEDLNAFLQVWRDRLRRTTQNLLGPAIAARADTSDVAQESVLQAWQDLKKFRGTSARQFAAWSNRIGRGQAAKIRRHHLAECRSAELDTHNQSPPLDLQNGPSQQAELQETLVLLAKSMERLPEQERAVVLLRIFESRTFREIALHIGKCESSARAIFATATKRLYQMLQQQGYHDSQ